MRRVLPLAGLLAMLILAPSGAHAATTASRSIRLAPGIGYEPLVATRGQRTVVRRGARVRVSARRARRRRSLAYFAQLSDLHITDETSPARKEYLASTGDASYRPQESLSTQAAAALIGAVNANRRSTHRSGRGRRAHLLLTLMTGDMTDNGQQNELGWFLTLMRGGTVDPSSGQPGRCPAGDAAAGTHRYTGVQRDADYPVGVSPVRRNEYWDPDVGGGGSRLGSITYPGLLERAQQPFTAGGLRGRWYAALGNHDALRQGLAPGTTAPFTDAVATDCAKPFPSDSFGAAQLGANSDRQAIARFGAPDVLGALRRDSRQVPGDARRRMETKPEFRKLLRASDQGGFGRVRSTQRTASKGAASYYGFTPRRGLRFISLDTNAEGGGSGGNIDDPQYRWLDHELDRNSSVKLDGHGHVHRDKDPDRLIVIFGHHRLEDMYVHDPDELSPCPTPVVAGCDADPRNSQPIHTGLIGKQPVVGLLKRYPNVVAYVAGHIHRNFVTPHFRHDRKGGLWEVSTAGGSDFPGQARLLDLMDNRDGTLSLFASLTDAVSPIAAPAPGTPAASMTDLQLASLSRTLAANGPVPRFATDALGSPGDRNAELVLRDPRRFERQRR